MAKEVKKEKEAVVKDCSILVSQTRISFTNAATQS